MNRCCRQCDTGGLRTHVVRPDRETAHRDPPAVDDSWQTSFDVCCQQQSNGRGWKYADGEIYVSNGEQARMFDLQQRRQSEEGANCEGAPWKRRLMSTSSTAGHNAAATHGRRPSRQIAANRRQRISACCRGATKRCVAKMPTFFAVRGHPRALLAVRSETRCPAASLGYQRLMACLALPTWAVGLI